MKHKRLFASAILVLLGTSLPLSVSALTPWNPDAIPGSTPTEFHSSAIADTLVRLRPHCESAGTGYCREFPLYDQETSITQGLKSGDTLDLDIVFMNPSRQPIQSIQSWLSYDPTVLKGVEVRIADSFPLVAPGEQAFDASGIVKLGASNVSGGVREPEFLFARVTFQVISPKGKVGTGAVSTGNEPVRVRFHEFSLLGSEGHTKALVVEEGRTVNVLKTRPNDLLLYFGTGDPPTLIQQPTLPPIVQPPVQNPPIVTPPVIQPPVVTPPVDDGGFSKLQPSVLRVTTKEDKDYLLWEPLTDPRVRGYNGYYGTVSGRYIQRRTVAADATGVTIRSLPTGKQYFFALSAFNAAEQESEFSYEVSVVVGDPQSSTAPFDLSALGEEPPDLPPVSGNGGVPGESGLPLLAGIALLIIAGIGSFFWMRSAAMVRPGSPQGPGRASSSLSA